MKNKTKKYILKNNSGMTLIELLVVLGLMGALAAMTLTSVGDMGSRGRYDETTNRMDLIREAVVGNGAEPGRFLWDMGRLPMVQYIDIDEDGDVDNEDKEGRVLLELWNPGNVPVYATTTSEDLKDSASTIYWPSADTNIHDSLPKEVDLACGWNGPYIQVNDPADAKLYDGFGNNFLAAITDTPASDTNTDWYEDPGETNEPTAGDTIYGVLTRGSDGDFSSTPSWDEDNRAALFTTQNTNLTVTLKAKDTTAAQPVWRELAECSRRTPGLEVEVNDVVFAQYDIGSITSRNNTENIDYEGICRKLSGDELFICIGTGTTNTSEPSAMASTAYGELVTDGSVVWKRLDDTELMVFRCQQTIGTSPYTTDNSSVPEWDVVSIGNTTPDNEIVWSYMGLASDLHYVTGIRVALFVPNVTTSNPLGVTWVLEQRSGTTFEANVDVVDETNAVVLRPGTRKIYAYAFREDISGTVVQPITSGTDAQAIDLQPGSNHVTLYLDTP